METRICQWPFHPPHIEFMSQTEFENFGRHIFSTNPLLCVYYIYACITQQKVFGELGFPFYGTLLDKAIAKANGYNSLAKCDRMANGRYASKDSSLFHLNNGFRSYVYSWFGDSGWLLLVEMMVVVEESARTILLCARICVYKLFLYMYVCMYVSVYGERY